MSAADGDDVPRRILGVDPGSRATGWAIIEPTGQEARAVALGVLRPSEDAPLHRRLEELHRGLRAVVEEHRPAEVAVEEVFTAHNARSALVLGQARGALLVAVSDQEVHEYAARAVKKAVVGYGQADKNQVAQMVQTLFRLSERPPQDAADALAVALCHMHSSRTRRRIQAAR